jgi:hypothetical protein
MAFDPTTARPVEFTRGFEFDPSTAVPEQPRSSVFDPSTATPFIDARTKTPEPTPEDQSAFRPILDVPVGLQKSVVTGIRMVSDMFGADSTVSKNLRLVEDHLAGLMSAYSKQDSQEIARLFKDAEDKGIGAQLAAAIKAFSIAPVDAVVTALGTSAPVIIAGLAATAAGAPTAAVLGTTAAVGAAMGAGTIKGAVYETVNEELVKAGVKPAEAEARAVKAQEYFGGNMGMITTGAGLGALASLTGAQPMIARMIANKIVRKGGSDISEQAARGYIGTAAKTGTTEAVPEFFQGSQEQLARNLALQKEGFDVPTMRGVVTQGTFEALAGAGLGAAAGATGVALERRADTQEQRAIDEAQTAIDAELKARISELEALPIRTPEQERELVSLIGEVESTEGVADVAERTEPIDGAVEPSVGLPSVPASDITAGIETPLSTGLGIAQSITGEPITGAAVQPSALEAQPSPLVEEATAPVVLSEPLPTVEEAVAVWESLPNKQERMIQEAPDGGFVIVARPVITPSAAPTTAAMGEAVPTETTGVAPGVAETAVPDAVQVTPTKAVETAPVLEPTEVITEEPSVAQAPEAVEAEAQRSEEAAPASPEGTASNVETQVADAVVAQEEARVPAAERKDPEAHKARMRTIKAFNDDVNRTLKSVEKLSTPITPEAFAARGVPDERTIALAEAGERTRLAQLWDKKFQLYIIAQNRSLTQPNGKPWKARQAAMDAVAKFTPEEVAQYKEAYDSYKAAERGAPLKSTSISTTSEANAAFGRDTNAQQALRRVMNTGTPFEKLLAKRLLNAVKGVKFVVIGPNTKLPPSISNAFRETTQGVYSEATKTIYVRDESFGDVNGVNNTTILHEALHAATTLRLDYALALAEQGELDTAPALQAFAQTMTKTMERAALVYRVAKAEGRSTPYLDGLNKVGVFTDVREFVSYGLTDNMMQQFLANQVPGMKMSLFSRFVEAIRKLFGFDANSQSAFQDLVVTTDALLSERLPRDASLIVTTPDTLSAIKKSGKESEKLEEKLRAPDSHPEESLTVIGQLSRVRSWPEFKDFYSDVFNGTSSQLRDGMLNARSTDQIIGLKAAQDIKEKGDEAGKPVLNEVQRNIEKMMGARMTMLDETSAVAKEWHDWQRANPDKYRVFNRFVHLATINEIDPAVNPERSKTLTDMYESLGANGKALYNKVKNFNEARAMRLKDVTKARINALDIDDASKEMLLARIDKQYEDMPKPYFALVREGRYWVRIGNAKSRDMKYYQFEDPRERNFFVRQEAKARGMTVEEFRADGNLMEMGDDYRKAVDEGMRSSKMSNEIMKLIDNASFVSRKKPDGTLAPVTEEEAVEQRESLKDAVYQLYLTTLPEQSFRKRFLHRKGTAGYRSDALRNFAKVSSQSATYLSQVEYGPQIRNVLTRAWDLTEGDPRRRELLSPIINELKLRVEDLLVPPQRSALGANISNVLGSTNFVYYMSAPASSLTNMSSLAVFTLPVLSGEFTPTSAAAAMAKNMNIFKSVGVTDKNGRYTFPTLVSRLSGHRREAYMEGLLRQKITATQTYDALNIADEPSVDYTGRMSFMHMAGYIFHHGEKLTREVTFMSAYDLAYDRAIKAGRDGKTAQEEAINEAGRMTDEALFNYAEYNKPRFMKGNFARVLFQFKFFAHQTASYLIKNFYGMTKGLDPKSRRTARHKFLGMLGMTALFAGTTGLPFMSFIIFPLIGLALGDDDEPEEEKRNPRLWFSKWLRTTFGESAGTAMERGPITWATNVDFHGRLKLDQLLIRDIKSGLTESEWMKEFMVSVLGPTVGLGINVAKAKERIDDGYIARGMEQLLPAGLRGFLAAARVNKEGYQTLKGDPIIPRSELSDFDLWVIRSGFSPAKVARIQDRLKNEREVVDAIIKRQSRVYTLFKNAAKESDAELQQEMFDKAGKELDAYNKANPTYAVTSSKILAAVKSEFEAGAMAVNGHRVPKKLIPLVQRLME